MAQQLIDCLRGAGLIYSLLIGHVSLQKVMSDILWGIDTSNLSLLRLLDRSSAFDTVDHEILLRRLEVSYSLHGTALSWFTSQSYLNGHTWFIRCRAYRTSSLGRLWSSPRFCPWADLVRAPHG